MSKVVNVQEIIGKVLKNEEIVAKIWRQYGKCRIYFNLFGKKFHWLSLTETEGVITDCEAPNFNVYRDLAPERERRQMTREEVHAILIALGETSALVEETADEEEEDDEEEEADTKPGGPPKFDTLEAIKFAKDGTNLQIFSRQVARGEFLEVYTYHRNIIWWYVTSLQVELLLEKFDLEHTADYLKLFNENKKFRDRIEMGIYNQPIPVGFISGIVERHLVAECKANYEVPAIEFYS